MIILLDTHMALRAVADTPKLSCEAVKLVESENNEVFYSMASVWESAIKYKIKPESMPMSEEEFVELCEKIGFIFFLKTLARLEDAPKRNDPFERMLLAQAKCEGMKLMTHDSLLSYYEEDCIMSV